VPPKRGQPQQPAADFSPEKAYTVLKVQLEKLQTLKGRNYEQARAEEDEWYNLTEKLVMRSFGGGSQNHVNFKHGRSAGEHRMVLDFEYRGPDHRLNQSNYEARLRAYEGVLRSSLAELELDLPDVGIKGVYDPGQEYEFYLDVKAIVSLAKQELFVIDPYLSREIFDTYASAIPRTVHFRLLGANVPTDVQTHAQKYASGGNFEFRATNAIHDRAIFADYRVWVCGQSLKDAAKKKPTYIVEHDGALMRPGYETIWAASQKLI
jgi:hypothetical protein